MINIEEKCIVAIHILSSIKPMKQSMSTILNCLIHDRLANETCKCPKRINVVLPYYAYARTRRGRQCLMKTDHGKIDCQIMLVEAGATRILTLEFWHAVQPCKGFCDISC